MVFLQFFGLKFNPFRKETPVDEFFAGNDWKELSSRLQYLQTTRGIGLVMGEPGVGKSTALRMYVRNLNTSFFHPYYLSYSTLTITDFLRGLALELGEEPGNRKVSIVAQIRAAINSMYYDRHITPVIILDEMHMASSQLFEELRLLLNFKMDSENPFILIFAAQPPIRNKLGLNVHFPLRQRILIRYFMTGLTREELSGYVTSRLELAGCNEPIFQPAALEAFYSVTNGFPRLVNSFATNCLLYAYENDQRKVDEEAVYQVQAELSL